MTQPSDPAAPRLHVEFFTEAVENPRKTREKNRPFFEDKEFVRIRFPGDKNRILVAPAAEAAVRDPATNERLSYIDRYPEHYKAFKENQTYQGDGTPLSELPFLTEAKRAELRAFNIHDAETLAALDGAPLQKLGMSARSLKDQAAVYLEKAQGGAAESRLLAENGALRQQMEAMQRQLAALQAAASGPGAQQVAETVPEPAPDSNTDATPDNFEGMTAAALKAFIKERTGAAPRGKPSRATLVRMAEDAAGATPVSAPVSGPSSTATPATHEEAAP